MTSVPAASGVPPAASISILDLLVLYGRVGAVTTDALRAALSNPDLSDNVSIAILCHLGAHGSRRPLDLQRVTGLSSSRITRAVDKLEAAGLVARSFGAVADDRRGTVITLTEAGEADMARVTAAVQGLVGPLRKLTREITELLGGLATTSNH